MRCYVLCTLWLILINIIFIGHQGRDKTYELVSKRFYWKSLWSDVQQHVQYCVKCQVNNDAKFSKKTASLHPVPVKSKVWNQVYIFIYD